MSSTNNYYRFASIRQKNDYRNEYRRDYARVLHSPSFRRLEGKTQLFPGNESDFFRNRLTHSLEVAQIAKTIAQKIIYENEGIDIEEDVCEISGLVHDLGHPPFGHNGENALDECMKNAGGFEGNAQTLRILTRLEKKEFSNPIITKKGIDRRVGLNLTARTIASSLKYDRLIPLTRDEQDPLQKGYYNSEKDIVSTVKQKVLGMSESALSSTFGEDFEFKTIECSIMDLADDISYSTYDLEDALKAGFLTPYDMMAASESILSQVVEKLDNRISIDECRTLIISLFADVWADRAKVLTGGNADEITVVSEMLTSYKHSLELASNGYLRTKFTSYLVNRFIDGIDFQKNEEYPILSTVRFNDETYITVNILKHFSHVVLINSSRLKVSENRGRDIIRQIFEKLDGPNGIKLLPEDYQLLYMDMKNSADRKRVLCDFIAGMTDRYALEFHGRLFSENPQSIFKPL